MIPRLPAGFTHPMRIGTGAFASVYRVRQTALDRWVALKFIYEKNSSLRQGLLKEAQTQARLRAECVPEVYDAYEWHGTVCMVMEWVRGISLAQLCEETLTQDDRIALSGMIIDALAEIHRRGFAHRDLKPENIIVSPETGIYLVDFGFTKEVDDVSRSTVGAAKGTPAYMAPELWSQGGAVDLMRADLYAAGKVLFRLLDGTPYASFTHMLLQINPLNRPASGIEGAALWKNSDHATSQLTWHNRAREKTAWKLSLQLFSAAQQLLYAHRNDEAYWLLVESVEEDANNHEAVELLGAFQEHVKHRTGRVRAVVSVVVLVAGITAAFLAGMKTGGGTQRRRWLQSSARSSAFSERWLTAAPAGGSAHLRRDTLRSNRLSGRMYLRSLREGTVVLIDNDTINGQEIVHNGIALHGGEHEVMLYRDGTRLVRGETVFLLPFERKVIDGCSTEELQRMQQ